MSIDEFLEAHALAAQRMPGRFKHLSLDRAASPEMLVAVEEAIGATLPTSYRAFLQKCGGGEFLSIVLFSADDSSDWYLPTRNLDASKFVSRDFVAFSDDQCGGYYLFKRAGKTLDEQVYYWNTDGGVVATDWKDSLSFISATAY